MKTKLAVLVGLALVLVASSGFAQPVPRENFGSAHQLAFGADRLFGFYGYSITTSWHEMLGVNRYDIQNHESGSAFGLIWANPMLSSRTGNDAIGARINPFVLPRLAFDFFVIDGLSVGGSLGYASTSGHVEWEQRVPNQPLTSTDLANVSMFVLAPRAGYALMFSHVIGIWPRMGFTYVRGGSDWRNPPPPPNPGKNETSVWLLNLNVDAMLVLSPVPHFAFTLGPVLDIGLTGGGEYRPPPQPPPVVVQPTDYNIRMHSYGFAIGLLGYI